MSTCSASMTKHLSAFLAVSCWTVAAAASTIPADPVVAAVGVPAGFASRLADLGDVKLHYVIGGQGAPLLLVHGWPETWYEWRKVMPRLAQRHTVIAVDLRGFGGSQLTASGYEKKALAEDLFKLMSRLGYTDTVLVGHDWGGPVAYAYAASHRDAVSQLVVVEGAPDGPWTQKRLLPLLHNPLWFFGFFQIPDYAETVLKGHERQFLDWFYRNKGFHVVPGSFSDADVDYYETSFTRPGRFAASIQLYRTIDQDILDNTEFAKTPLTIPVLAVGAQHGVGAGVAESLHPVAANVTPVLMEGTGHFIADERPDALADIVESFLDGKALAETWSPPESTPPVPAAQSN